MSKVEEANFSVEIKGLKVPQDVAKRMEDEIRQTVMKELGKIDLTGYQFTFSRLRPGWYGIPAVGAVQRQVPE